jgi:hypothetical protein
MNTRTYGRAGLTCTLIFGAATTLYTARADAQTGATGWTKFTSEEKSPIECDPGMVLNGAGCRGKYCDEISLFCRPASWADPVGPSRWSQWISEETYAVACKIDEIMTGLACKGSYCDEVSIRCTPVADNVNQSCSWSPAKSEEQGNVVFDDAFAIRGAKCTGSYCDNLSYLLCAPGG